MKEERSAHRGAHKAVGLAEGTEPNTGAGCWKLALLGLSTAKGIDRRSLTTTLKRLLIRAVHLVGAAQQTQRNAGQHCLLVASASATPLFSSPLLVFPSLLSFFSFCVSLSEY